MKLLRPTRSGSCAFGVRFRDDVLGPNTCGYVKDGSPVDNRANVERHETCHVNGCAVPASVMTEASDSRGIIARRNVCESHGRAFLEAVAALQARGLVDDTYMGLATSLRGGDCE